MDHATRERRLEEAESDVGRAQRNIISQLQIVAILEIGEHDASMARQLLKLFEIALAKHLADRDRLIEELVNPR